MTSSDYFFQSVLLLEDEIALSEALKIALKKLPVKEIHHATTLKEAFVIFRETPFEVAVLDRTLPDGDGIDFCTELRSQGFTGAVLFLTARGEIKDRVEGLRSGGDDYLPKPFSFEELQARLMALSRRFKKEDVQLQPNTLWQLDSTRLRIFGLQGWVQVTPLEFKLAKHLIDAHGAIVSREELLKEVWGFRFLPKTRTVDFFMRRLRTRFEKDPDKPRHFITARGAGYRFTLKPLEDSEG